MLPGPNFPLSNSRGQGGNDEAVCRAAWGGGHGHQKARQLSCGGSGIDKAQTKLKLMRGAEESSSSSVNVVNDALSVLCEKPVVVVTVLLQN